MQEFSAGLVYREDGGEPERGDEEEEIGPAQVERRYLLATCL